MLNMLQLLSITRFTSVLPDAADTDFGLAFWVAGIKNILKVAGYHTTEDVNFAVNFGKSTTARATANPTLLAVPSPFSQNTLNGTNQVSTDVSTVTRSANRSYIFSLPSYSVALFLSDVQTG